ncbi:hypothetical protein AAUPMC_04419, partial [Pasteurella multocida subsp. multocida str. Anand1_cattle]
MYSGLSCLVGGSAYAIFSGIAQCLTIIGIPVGLA